MLGISVVACAAGAAEMPLAKARMLEARILVNCISNLIELEVGKRREVKVYLEAKAEELDDEIAAVLIQVSMCGSSSLLWL